RSRPARTRGDTPGPPPRPGPAPRAHEGHPRAPGRVANPGRPRLAPPSHRTPSSGTAPALARPQLSVDQIGGSARVLRDLPHHWGDVSCPPPPLTPDGGTGLGRRRARRPAPLKAAVLPPRPQRARAGAPSLPLPAPRSA